MSYLPEIITNTLSGGGRLSLGVGWLLIARPGKGAGIRGSRPLGMAAWALGVPAMSKRPKVCVWAICLQPVAFFEPRKPQLLGG